MKTYSCSRSSQLEALGNPWSNDRLRHSSGVILASLLLKCLWANTHVALHGSALVAISSHVTLSAAVVAALATGTGTAPSLIAATSLVATTVAALRATSRSAISVDGVSALREDEKLSRTWQDDLGHRTCSILAHRRTSCHRSRLVGHHRSRLADRLLGLAQCSLLRCDLLDRLISVSDSRGRRVLSTTDTCSMTLVLVPPGSPCSYDRFLLTVRYDSSSS